MPDTIANNKRIAKNTFFLYGRMLLVLFANLFITRTVLKSLGVVDYGIYNVVAGFVSMFAFMNTSMSIGIQRFYNYEKGKGNEQSFNEVYNSALIIQFLIGILTLALLESVGIWYVNHIMIVPDERLFATNCVYQFSILSLFFVIMQVPCSAAIMANERMDFFAFVSIFDVLCKLVIVLVIPIVPFDSLIFYGTFTALVSLIDLVCYFCYIKKQFKGLYLNIRCGKKYFKPVLSFSFWNLFDMFAFTMKVQGLNVLLNGFFGPVVNAARGVAAQIMSAIQGFSSNIVTAFRPQLIESYAQGDYQRTNNLMFNMSKISYGLLYILSLPVVLELDFILNLWLGGNVPDYTIIFTKLVLIDMLINSLNTPLSQVVQAVGKLKTYQSVRSIVVLLILPISWGALKLGANPSSVFMISIVISIFNQLVSMYLLHQVYNYSYRSYYITVIFPCFLLTLLSIPIPVLVMAQLSEGFGRLIITTLLSVVICIVLSFVIMLNKEQKNEVIRKIKIRIQNDKI